MPSMMLSSPLPTPRLLLREHGARPGEIGPLRCPLSPGHARAQNRGSRAAPRRRSGKTRQREVCPARPHGCGSTRGALEQRQNGLGWYWDALARTAAAYTKCSLGMGAHRGYVYMVFGGSSVHRGCVYNSVRWTCARTATAYKTVLGGSGAHRVCVYTVFGGAGRAPDCISSVLHGFGAHRGCIYKVYGASRRAAAAYTQN